MTANPAAHAYDTLAPVYDAHMEGDLWMRQVLWARYDSFFRPGDRVLDLGCGTGTDAMHLAAGGVSVTGVDASAGMVALAQEKVASAGLADLVRLKVMDLNEIGGLDPARFDGVISAFAALNTLPSLASVADDAYRLLRPAGRMIVHLLNTTSLREWLALLRRGRWKDAGALSRERERVFVLAGEPVRHYLVPGQELYARIFSEHFRLDRQYGLGLLRSARNSRHTAPGVDVVARADACIGSYRPFANWCRFVVLELTRTA